LDAAEQWLAQHDPDYEKSSLSWKDIGEDGVYETPEQEVPVGNALTLEAMVSNRDGEWVSDAARWAERVCLICETTFMPYREDHSYCSDACRQKAYRIRVVLEVPND
jgi:hypothetical protein